MSTPHKGDEGCPQSSKGLLLTDKNFNLFLCDNLSSYFDLYCIFYFIALKKEPNPSQIFRANIADISEAIESNLERIADRLFSETLVGHDILQSTTIDSIPKYQKARKIVHEIYSQLQAHSEPKQYLIQICNVLLKQDNQRLKDIANSIKDKL